MSKYKVIGTRPIRHDGTDKVTGRAVYGADVKVQGCIWGDVLRSPYVHADILSIDTTDAEKMQGVFAVCTAEDIPKSQSQPIDMTKGADNIHMRAMTILAHKKVLYKGHIVAAVAAVDRNTAQEACKRIKVVYKPLPSVKNVKEAISEDAPILNPQLIGDHLGKPVSNTNIAQQFRYEFGEPESALQKCDLVVSKEFALSTVHQGYIEPHNATALWDVDGKLKLWSSTQGMFGVQLQTSAILGIPKSDVTVNPVEIGGGFGGKTVIYLPPIAAILSRKSGRPVKIVMDRSSIFEATGPAPGGLVKVTMGVDKSGKIQAATVDIMFEAGGFPGSSVSAAAVCALAAYNIPNTRIDGYDILVNKPKSAAYRAPGSPQAAFAVEQVVDEICEKLNFDTLQFRLDNASQEGTRRGDGVKFNRIGLIETLNSIKNSDHWNTKLTQSTDHSKLRGRGIATGFWRNGGNKSCVALALDSNGKVFLNEGSQDIGGTRASIAMQVAEFLGIPAIDVHPSIPSTDNIGFTATTGGSRVTYATGYAAWLAAKEMVEILKSRVAKLWQIPPQQIEFHDSVFYSKSDPELKISLKTLAPLIDETGGPVQSSASVNLPDAGNAFGVHVCDIEIDKQTGKTTVLRYTAAQDVGCAIHPAYVEGQITGGVAQGIGWVLNEEYFMDQEGKMLNSSFLDYRMPTSLDLPNVETLLVEIPNPLHPYGVRGVGEVPIVPPLPAVANAIKKATGIRFFETPIKPGKILSNLNGAHNGSIK